MVSLPGYLVARVRVSTKALLCSYANCMPLKKSTILPYNPCGLRCLIRHCMTYEKPYPKTLKPNWPSHIDAMIFAYNDMPHSTTGYQPY